MTCVQDSHLLATGKTKLSGSGGDRITSKGSGKAPEFFTTKHGGGRLKTGSALLMSERRVTGKLTMFNYDRPHTMRASPYTLPPTNMEVQRGPFQEESSLSIGGGRVRVRLQGSTPVPDLW